MPRAAAPLAAALLAFLAVLLLAFAPLCAQDRPVIMDASALTDPDGALTLAEILRPPLSRQFAPLSLPAFLKAGDETTWIKLDIAYPPGAQAGSWDLDLGWDHLRSLDIHFPGESKAQSFISGDYNTFIHAVTPLPRLEGRTLTCYLRLTGYGGVNLNPAIVSQAERQRRDSLRLWLLGAFFGVLGAMFIYNALLAINIKDQSYLWYALHVGFLFTYAMFLNGVFPITFSMAAALNFERGVAFICINNACMFLSMGLFSRSFLLTGADRGWLRRILRVQLGVSLIFLILGLIFPTAMATAFAPVAGMVTALSILIVAGARLYQGYKPARYFFPGWLIYLAGGALHSMAWAGAVPATAITMHALEAGAALEVLIMSLALAYRVKLLQEEKNRAEQERQRLAEKSALFSILLENNRLGICLVRDGVFAWANPRLGAMIGYDNDVRGVGTMVFPGLETLLAPISASSPARGVTREARLVLGGTARELRALGQRVSDARYASAVVWVVEDVTEQKRLERLKEEIDQVVRHDLKSPLFTIGSLRQAIASEGPLNERQQNLCTMIGEAAAQALEQLNISLLLYKIESERFTPEYETVDLGEALNGAVEELSPYFGEGDKRKKLLLTGDWAAAPKVVGERIMLHTALTNLAKNALEAMPQDGVLEARCVLTPKSATVFLTNPGEVPPQMRGRFFEKYATHGKERGTGLGTYSARLIARAMGGEVELEPSAPGYTTVSLRLRRAA